MKFRRIVYLLTTIHFINKQVLLVSSSKYPERWIVPGGGVEQDETNAETAVREILEEAGVVGRLERCLGVFEVSQPLNCYKTLNLITC